MVKEDVQFNKNYSNFILQIIIKVIFLCKLSYNLPVIELKD